MPRIQKSAIERVLPRVVSIPWSGCWIFMGALNDFGYGIVGKGGRGEGNDRAHRVTYEHFRGPIPDGMFVCHHCDVPSCCNPDHLFLGNNNDNMRDCREKGRDSKPPRNPHVIGSVHPSAKMTEETVREMRTLREQGWTLHALAARYGIHSVSALKICRGDRWKHVA